MFLAIAPGAVSEMHAVASMRKTIPMNAQVTGSWFRVAIARGFWWISPWNFAEKYDTLNDRPMSLKCSLFSAVLVCPITYIYTIHIWHTLYMFSIQIYTCVYPPWPFHCITIDCKIVIKHAYLWSPRTAGVTFTVKDRHTCVSPVAYHALKHAKQVPLPNIWSSGSIRFLLNINVEQPNIQ